LKNDSGKRWFRTLVIAIVLSGVMPDVSHSASPGPSTTAAADASAAFVARGRYMVVTGHCNNCHTGGYAAKQGNVPEKDWLLGNPVGFRSELGTTYASNLRLTIQNFSEEQWVAYAKNAKPRPPMPWWSMHDTSEEDLRAMFRYVRHLGAAGQPAPAFVPPDRDPSPPYETRQLVR
jgi:mono/diheme cytochrome c family protein